MSIPAPCARGRLASAGASRRRLRRGHNSSMPRVSSSSSLGCHVFLLRHLDDGAWGHGGGRAEKRKHPGDTYLLGTGHWAGDPFLWKVTTQRDTSLIPTWLPVRDVLTATSRDRHAYTYAPLHVLPISRPPGSSARRRIAIAIQSVDHHTTRPHHPSVHRPPWRRRSAST
jgi:hypothetical protein